MREKTTFTGLCHVTISLILTRPGFSLVPHFRATAATSRIISSVEAGTGVALGPDVLGRSLGNRVKLLQLTPEPKPISVGIVVPKGRLSPAAEKFWQGAKEAAAK
jgi:DNA-binding transcriptional LysR family regulator